MVCTKCSNCPVGGDYAIPAGAFINPNNRFMRFDEPEQGKFADCWFVAALSSFLFVNRRYAPLEENGKYKFTFYSRNNISEVRTSGNVCREGRTSIYGAKAVEGTTTYSWPAVYEKAYGAFLENATTPPDPPEMQKYINRDGNAISCLLYLKGGNSQVFLTSAYIDGSAIFSKIREKTSQYNANNLAVTAPYVAFTKNGNPGIGIKSEHSYSVLGLYQSDGNQYIILRDPQQAGAPYGQNVEWTYLDKVTNRPTTVNCAVNNGKGIFAITPANFKTSLEGFGYVQ